MGQVESIKTQPSLRHFAGQRPITPPCPRGLEQFDYELNGVDLVCHIEYTAPERGSRERGTGLQMEPDYPACANLWAAYADGVEVTKILSDDFVMVIENAFLEQDEEF